MPSPEFLSRGERENAYCRASQPAIWPFGNRTKSALLKGARGFQLPEVDDAGLATLNEHRELEYVSPMATTAPAPSTVATTAAAVPSSASPAAVAVAASVPTAAVVAMCSKQT